MTSISNALYPGLSSYASSSSLLSGLTSSAPTTQSDDTSKTSAKTSDVVTLSPAVTTAQSREYLGLPATGPITRSNFEEAVAQQKKTVNDILTSTVKSLGIDEAQDITLSLDDDGNIVIKEKFNGKDELEKALNNDAEFIQAFAGLSANTEVLNYAEALQTKSTSLVDYFNKDKGESDLLALAAKYTRIKSGSSAIESLWSLSHSEMPFSYTLDGKEDA